MNEREKPFSEEQMQEFWDGHSKNDDCQIFIPSKRDATWRDILILPVLLEYNAEYSRFNRERKRILEELKLYLATPRGNNPVKRFDKGQVFKLDQHPKGTIVRFEHDWQLSLDRPLTRIFWGKITQSKKREGFRDILIAFPEYRLTGGYSSPSLGREFNKDFNIGEVNHRKYDGGYLNNYFDRTNWLEVWKFGQEVRERTEERKGMFGRVLQPQTWQSLR